MNWNNKFQLILLLLLIAFFQEKCWVHLPGCRNVCNMLGPILECGGAGSVVGIATMLQAGRSGDRILVGARFSTPVQTGPGAHPASCTMGPVSFPGVKSS